MSQLTFGSLFAGIGGFDLGFERAGWRCDWQVEINDFCKRVLTRHWPHVEKHDDIRTFEPSGYVDCIVGGFPCKQTSTAAAIHGRRTGLAGEDSGLWFEMLRIVRLVRPAIVVVENVAGANTYADQIKEGLAAAFYRVPKKPLRLSAWDFGAFNRRRRLFWIANSYESGLSLTRLIESRTTISIERRATDGNARLPADAGVVRVADGVPGGVDRRERIYALGNAVYPAVSEWIGRRLMEANQPLAQST